jgi:hypothetical protein
MPTLTATGSLEMTLVARPGTLTRWLEGSCTCDGVPLEMFEDFRAAGWTLKVALTYEMEADGDPVRTSRTVLDFTISRPGSGFHCQWTQTEALCHLQQALRILARHGFDKVPTRRPLLADRI